jgi:MoxR-like ATPase
MSESPHRTAAAASWPGSVDEVTATLAEQAYLAGRGLATALLLALELRRPLLLEGEAGVGKTEVARALAAGLGCDLVRLQCYEGIDASQALYEWDYARQLLAIRTAEAGGGEPSVDAVFSPRYLVERPLLAALRAGPEAVLLIDEIDRADDEFEAFLLEVLSDFAVTVPEVGTIRAEEPPVVVLTSNRTRELHDALKRRCLYHWIDYPDPEREAEIVAVRAPDVPESLARAAAAVVARLRELDLAKPPGIAETIDWVQALARLDRAAGGAGETLRAGVALDALGALIKEREDLDTVREALPSWLAAEEGRA